MRSPTGSVDHDALARCREILTTSSRAASDDGSLGRDERLRHGDVVIALSDALRSAGSFYVLGVVDLLGF